MGATRSLYYIDSREVSVNLAVDPRAKVQPDWVLLDNQADISIVHLRFLRELQSCNEVRVNDIGGLLMTVTETGHLDIFSEYIQATR